MTYSEEDINNMSFIYDDTLEFGNLYDDQIEYKRPSIAKNNIDLEKPTCENEIAEENPDQKIKVDKEVEVSQDITKEENNNTTNINLEKLACENKTVEVNSDQKFQVDDEVEESQDNATYTNEGINKQNINSHVTKKENNKVTIKEVQRNKGEIQDTEAKVEKEKRNAEHTSPEKGTNIVMEGMLVPSPFKKALFWPDETVSKQPFKKKKEQIPSVTTSDAWKEYYLKKEEEKKKLNEEIADRKRKREEKKNIPKRTVKKTRKTK